MRDPRQRFRELLDLPEGRIDLAEGALLIAAEACPDLDLEFYLGELEVRAEELRPLVDAGRNDRDRALRLVHGLHGIQGFAGNQRHYDDPRNSYLNEVLDSRTGIPVTLCLVYMEVAKRLDLPVHGVGFPGHFLACYDAEAPILIDAFYGRLLSQDDCRERLRDLQGPQAVLREEHLRAATPRQILRRMLANLKALHVQASSWDAALRCCDRLLLLDPDDALELRDRGLVYERLECHGAAFTDLERFLELAPDDPSSRAIHRQLDAVRRRARSIH